MNFSNISKILQSVVTVNKAINAELYTTNNQCEKVKGCEYLILILDTDTFGKEYTLTRISSPGIAP